MLLMGIREFSIRPRQDDRDEILGRWAPYCLPKEGQGRVDDYRKRFCAIDAGYLTPRTLPPRFVQVYRMVLEKPIAIGHHGFTW
jgi:hypothetical protein